MEHDVNKGGYDVRSIANVVIDEAKAEGIAVTNLHLNKTLFFIHVEYLRRYGLGLVSAKIEAWQYGPVFREVYNQFKIFKSSAIDRYAMRVDFDTGELCKASDTFPGEVEQFVKELARFYLKIPAGVLVDISHAKGGAWDAVWNSGESINVGMEITEEIILKHELSKDPRVIIQ